MFTLAHISDIHLGPLPQLSPRELVSKRITGFLNWHRNRRKHLGKNTLENLLLAIADEAPDHLAITGDLVNLATTKEIENAAEWLKSVGPAKDVSLVPGNHDAYVGGAYAKVAKAWHDNMQGDDVRPLSKTSDSAHISLPAQTWVGGADWLFIRDRIATLHGHRGIREKTSAQNIRAVAPGWRGRVVSNCDDPSPAGAQCGGPPQATDRNQAVSRRAFDRRMRARTARTHSPQHRQFH
nr:metallophosphoesterase [Marinicella sp. W31]MDC2878034.1 metallophosphoesterase [Marinicella sp. W31]